MPDNPREMNLLAFFETLEIDRETLGELDENALIRIEKQVHLQRKLHPDIDMNLANSMITALRHDGRAFRFLLENRRLYNFFTGKFHPAYQFHPEKVQVEQAEVQNFIDRYLRDDLTLALDKYLVANQFEDLDNILEEKDNFPEDVQYGISIKLQSKLDFAMSRMFEKKYDKIQFLKFRTFYNCINHFSSSETDTKMSSLLSVVSDQYNAGQNRDFAIGVMIAMAYYETDDDELKRVLNSNSAIVTSPRTTSGGGSSFSWGSLRVILFAVFIVIKLVVFGSKCSNSSSSTSYDYEDSYQPNAVVLEELRNEMGSRSEERFRDYLTAFDSSSIYGLEKIDTLKTGDKVFKRGSIVSGIETDTIVKFTNKSGYDVILMQQVGMIPGKSVYIKNGESAQIKATNSHNTVEYRAYIGSKPAVFKTNTDSGLNELENPEIRFLKLDINTAVAFEKAFTLKGNVTLKHVNRRFTLVGEKVICSDCISARNNSGEQINMLN